MDGTDILKSTAKALVQVERRACADNIHQQRMKDKGGGGGWG